jgi:hypothetical protein
MANPIGSVNVQLHQPQPFFQHNSPGIPQANDNHTTYEIICELCKQKQNHSLYPPEFEIAGIDAAFDFNTAGKPAVIADIYKVNGKEYIKFELTWKVAIKPLVHGVKPFELEFRQTMYTTCPLPNNPNEQNAMLTEAYLATKLYVCSQQQLQLANRDVDSKIEVLKKEGNIFFKQKFTSDNQANVKKIPVGFKAVVQNEKFYLDLNGKTIEKVQSIIGNNGECFKWVLQPVVLRNQMNVMPLSSEQKALKSPSKMSTPLQVKPLQAKHKPQGIKEDIVAFEQLVKSTVEEMENDVVLIWQIEDLGDFLGKQFTQGGDSFTLENFSHDKQQFENVSRSCYLRAKQISDNPSIVKINTLIKYEIPVLKEQLKKSSLHTNEKKLLKQELNKLEKMNPFDDSFMFKFIFPKFPILDFDNPLNANEKYLTTQIQTKVDELKLLVKKMIIANSYVNQKFKNQTDNRRALQLRLGKLEIGSERYNKKKLKIDELTKEINLKLEEIAKIKTKTSMFENYLKNIVLSFSNRGRIKNFIDQYNNYVSDLLIIYKNFPSRYWIPHTDKK